MDRWMKRKPAGKMLAWVVLGLPLLASGIALEGRSAAGQSAVTLGSALDQPAAGDSLLPSGSFRLDGPSENSLFSETSGDPHAGATALGLQIYGSGSGLSAPRPAEQEPAPASPPSSTPARP